MLEELEDISLRVDNVRDQAAILMTSRGPACRDVVEPKLSELNCNFDKVSQHIKAAKVRTVCETPRPADDKEDKRCYACSTACTATLSVPPGKQMTSSQETGGVELSQQAPQQVHVLVADTADIVGKSSLQHHLLQAKANNETHLSYTDVAS